MKIAVLGSHPATVWMAPFHDPDWRIWACSPHNFEKRELPRVDEWFEVHLPAHCPKTRRKPYLEYVRSLSPEIPVWARDRTPFPLAKEYPEKELKAEFRPGWFSSSIAYIMAKAIVEQPEAIGLFGIMQASETEFAYQRPGIQDFIWEAHRRGIDVVVPDASCLFMMAKDIW